MARQDKQEKHLSRAEDQADNLSDQLDYPLDKPDKQPVRPKDLEVAVLLAGGRMELRGPNSSPSKMTDETKPLQTRDKTDNVSSLTRIVSNV